MTIKTAKLTLTALWAAAIAPLLLILILRQINGFYGGEAQVAWTWAAQFVFPNLTLIGGAWTVTEPPDAEKPSCSGIVFWGALTVSVFYIGILYVVLGTHSVGSARSSFEGSSLFLGLLQSVVVGWLGKFFIEARR